MPQWEKEKKRKTQEQEEQLEENIKLLGKKAQRTTEDLFF